MQFSDDDLKEALRRKDPGPGFSQRVMSRIGQQEADASAKKNASAKLPWWRFVLGPRPALAGVLAALVLMIGGGLGYQQYQRVQEKKRVDAQKAEVAKEQVVQALKITNAKLTHVFRRVNEPSAGDNKIRRQSL